MGQNTPISLIRQRAVAFAGAPLGLGPAAPVRSLYIHIPFCFHKCHYCDFYSLVDTRDRQAPFVDRLIRELRALAPWAGGMPLKTIFVGGGTPSLLRADLWEGLLATLREEYGLLADGEFTVECNPETVGPDLMGVLAAGGVNRVSIGAQSFDRAHLKTLERWHDPENVARAVDLARAAGIARQSIDLIFGIPGQTPEQWRADLEAGLALRTTHISCYNLTYEPNTAMTARRNRNEFAPADEDAEVEMFEETVRVLRAAGIERYEVSNFARVGDEARHNLAYWRQEQWLAAGPSASAHVGGHRWKNVPRLDDYLAHEDRGFAPIVDHEPPDAQRAIAERLMTGLRLAEGVGRDEIAAALAALPGGEPAMERIERVADRYVASGRLTRAADRWAPTDSGFLIADAIAADFMGALDG